MASLGNRDLLIDPEGLKVGSRAGPSGDTLSLDLEEDHRAGGYDHIGAGYNVWRLG